MKTSKLSRRVESKNSNVLWLICLVVFFIRLIHALLLRNHAYLGADGPNYITGFLSIIKEGVYSSDQHLLYWPPGYSFFMFIAYLLVPTNPLLAVSLIQNILCGLGIFFFSKRCSSKFVSSRYALYLCIVLNINPMIYGMSLSIGYESIVISLYLIIIAVFLKGGLPSNSISGFLRLAVLIICMGVIVSFQPRLIITNIVIIVFFYIWRVKFNNFLVFSVIFLLFANAAAPLAYSLRNHKVHGAYIVSSNLADTLLIGAGDHATGAYNENPKGIPCTLDTTSISNREKSLTSCVLHWYATHPLKATKLFLNKAIFFWSPWSGPLSKGTLASHPWRMISPADLLEKHSNSLFLITVAKAFSALYLFGYIGITLLGYRQLLRRESDLVVIRLAHVSLLCIFANMLISMATIGDNRFRVPVLGFLILLQLYGVKCMIPKLRSKIKKTELNI